MTILVHLAFVWLETLGVVHHVTLVSITWVSFTPFAVPWQMVVTIWWLITRNMVVRTDPDKKSPIKGPTVRWTMIRETCSNLDHVDSSKSVNLVHLTGNKVNFVEKSKVVPPSVLDFTVLLTVMKLVKLLTYPRYNFWVTLSNIIYYIYNLYL